MGVQTRKTLDSLKTTMADSGHSLVNTQTRNPWSRIYNGTVERNQPTSAGSKMTGKTHNVEICKSSARARVSIILRSGWKKDGTPIIILGWSVNKNDLAPWTLRHPLTGY